MLTDTAGYDVKYGPLTLLCDGFRDIFATYLRRKPAWTDRILHKFSPFVPVSQRSYDAHPWITMSDHRPVSAEFLVDVSHVRQALYKVYSHPS